MTTRVRKHKPGRITFVGSGPGDPGLLTTRARNVLAHAALVFTDPDVPEAVLAARQDDLAEILGPALTSMLGNGTSALAGATLCGAAALFIAALISTVQLFKLQVVTS